MFLQPFATAGGRTFIRITDELQLPHMGFEQSEDEDEQPSPKEKEQSKYHSAEQQPETLHNCTILQGDE